MSGEGVMEDYEILGNGVVHQVNSSPFLYDERYAEDRYKDFPKTISYTRLGYIISQIKRLPYSILDFGYGTGQFLEVVRDANIPSYGYDIAPCDPPSGVERVPSCLNDHYDVITFFDSLEHCEDIDFVKNLQCNYVVLSVPSCNHPNDPSWFLEWKHRKFNEHLWHFSPAALTTFMEECGYSLVDQQPLEDVIRNDEDYNPNIITGIYKRGEKMGGVNAEESNKSSHKFKVPEELQ